MANRTASNARENSVCTSTQIFTATTTKTITATAQPSCSPTYNATASPGKYACQCLTSSKSVNLNATASICTSFSSSGEPVCYPLSPLPLLLSFYTTTFILIDARLDPQKIDLEFIQWMGEEGLPFALVFTKADKISKNELMTTVKNWEKKISKP